MLQPKYGVFLSFSSHGCVITLYVSGCIFSSESSESYSKLWSLLKPWIFTICICGKCNRVWCWDERSPWMDKIRGMNVNAHFYNLVRYVNPKLHDKQNTTCKVELLSTKESIRSSFPFLNVGARSLKFKFMLKFTEFT